MGALRGAFSQCLVLVAVIEHPTCQHPGLEGGLTQHPADYAERAFEGMSEATIEKVLHGTAARLYGIK